MRALLAGLFVFVMLLLASSLIGSHSTDNTFPWWGIPLILGTLVGSIIISLILFNKSGKQPSTSGKEWIAELRAKGLLAEEKLEARRAFEVDEFEDEGSHFYIELTDGTVLFLTGQYLYDLRGGQNADGSTFTEFPCSQFTLLRNKETNEVIDILCAGSTLPIECVAPPFTKKDFESDSVPEDGAVIRDRSYDDIKKERMTVRK